jgi:hypothetical protein
MADLASILTDPNYVNANEATKRAIFDKFSAQDPNFTKANPATQDAIRERFGVATPKAAPLPQSMQPSVAQVSPDAIPGNRQELTTGQRIYQAVRPYAAPLVEAGGAIGGGLLGGAAGTFGAGPVGTAAGGVAGAGLGYGIAKEALEAADVAMGIKQPRTGAALVTEPVRNVVEGATFEAGGRVLGPVIGKVVGKVMDIRNIPANKAATLARASLGQDLDQTLNALRNASPNASVAEITAKIQNPAWQALVRDALEKSPSGAQYLNKFATMSHDEGVNALAKLVGGTTAAEARGTTTAMKEALNTTQGPVREASLNRANLGKAVADYEAQAGKLSAEAAAEVQKVRDLINAGKIAEASARLDLIKGNLPVGLTKYTYKGDLARMADEWASKAADASLDLGQGARFAQGAADAMRSVGIKPLKGDEVIGSVRAIANNPEFAGNDLLLGAVKNVADDITKWTGSGGIIDARALDAIRKNSINAAIQQLRPGVDATTQRNLAAEVMGKLKPTLIDAIEAAGGTGYRQYLTDYAKGMQQIAEKKLTGEAMQLWKTDKDAFVRLVQNESPEVVEKFLGPGNYNIATELSENTLSVLQAQAEKRIAQLAASKQASDGEKALTTLLRENTSRFRLPSWLSFWGAAANKTISELEKAVGSKSMKVLAEAMQSPEGAQNLLERLPAEERSRVLKLISDPSQWSQGAKAIVRGTTAAGVNALAPERNNSNALAKQPVRIIETQE